jgi:CheY-like chemotaxis protein
MKKVLIASDNLVVEKTVKKILGKLSSEGVKFLIYSAKTDYDGIKLLLSLTPDILIIDLNLPRYAMKGLIEYLQTNVELLWKIKIIILNEKDDANVFLQKAYYINKTERNAFGRLENSFREIWELKRKRRFYTYIREFVKSIFLKFQNFLSDYML